jgi:hypothetical protein
MVSFRSLIEAKDGFVIWLPKSREANAWIGQTFLGVTIGQRQAKINADRVTMEAAATLQNARTMVPLTFVVEGLGLTMTRDEATNHYRLTSSQPE